MRNKFKIKVQTLLDLIFYLREQERNDSGCKSHFKNGSDKYNWYQMWENRHKSSREDVEHYLMRLSDHEAKYGAWLNRKEVTNV